MRQVKQKQKPFQSAAYKKDVKRLIKCVVTGQEQCDFHHIKGLKRGTGANDDRLGIPLTREQHTLLHNDPKKWELMHGKQIDHCKRVLEQARYHKLLPDDLIDEALLELI